MTPCEMMYTTYSYSYKKTIDDGATLAFKMNKAYISFYLETVYDIHMLQLGRKVCHT